MVDSGKGKGEVVEDVAELLEAKKNVFLNGGAGTGRSELVKQIVEWCERNNKEVSIVVPTGVCSSLADSKVETLTINAAFGLVGNVARQKDVDGDPRKE